MVILIDLGKVFNKIKHPASTNLTQERRTLTQTRPYVHSITKCLRFFFPLRNQEHWDTHFYHFFQQRTRNTFLKS